MKKIKKFLIGLVIKFRAADSVFLVTMAVIIGLLCGVGAVSIQYLIKWFQHMFWGAEEFPPEHMAMVPFYLKIIIPTLGATAVGALVYFFAREAKGHGVPEVMQAVALRNGIIRPRVAIVKLLASSLFIGSGGSVGREGPVIQIGSAIGSAVGQLFRLNPQRLKIFVASGAAAGIAAAFNAPVAGAIFSLEIILGDFAIAQFSPIVIASVVATVVSRGMVGDFPAFTIPRYELVSPYELITYTILGVLAGVVSLIYIRVLYRFEDFFEDLKIHEILKTTIGGLLLGMLGIWVPQIFGVGYHAMDRALHGALESPFGNEYVWLFMLALVFIKILATSISLGSGGSGGVFAPSLFIGTMTGGFFGELVHRFFPTITAGSGAYALVGMGALVAGTTHAPITAILIIFEMTNDYKIILPLMITCVIATLLTTRVQKESIYTLKLIRRGINLFQGKEVNVLRSLPVREVMLDNPILVSAATPFNKLVELFFKSQHPQFFVVDDKKRLLGRIGLGDLRRILQEEEYLADLVVAHDIMNSDVERIHENDTLDTAMHIFGRSAAEELPVVKSDGSNMVIGAVFYQDVIQAYNRELIKSDLVREAGSSIKLLEKSQRISFLDGYSMAEVAVPMSIRGKTLQELNLRSRFGVNVLMIKRKDEKGAEKQLVAMPNEKLLLGDHLIVMGRDEDIDKLKAL